MKVGHFPLSWDTIDFVDIRQVVDEACDPHISARFSQLSSIAEAAYNNPGLMANGPTRVDQRYARQMKGQLSRFINKNMTMLQNELTLFDARYLLAGISVLGSIPATRSSDPITTPGFYDRELEWLSGIPISSQGDIPTWDRIIRTIEIARKCLIAEQYRHDLDETPSKRAREKSVFAKELGATYVPIAREMTERLTEIIVSMDHPLSNTSIAQFASDSDRILDSYVRAMRRLFTQIIGRDALNLGHREMISKIIETIDVKRVVDLFLIPISRETTDNLELLISETLDDQKGCVELRDKPLLRINDSFLLALPRRMACDRHELLDQLISIVLKQSNIERGNYSDIRARVLDEVIADSLRILLPGSTVLVGKDWDIDGKLYERDVVALFEDIAVCVETKAPRMVPSRSPLKQDASNLLRNDVSEATNQVTHIAHALESGNAIAGSTNVRQVRRAYKLVATFNAWWGTETDTQLLIDSSVLPTPESAMLTSADKFVCYEKIFYSPADFIAYLDYRLDVQTRPWIKVADEFELIGGYFTNIHSGWMKPLPQNAQKIVKANFQDDVTQTIMSSYNPIIERSHWIDRKHSWLIQNQLVDLEAAQPKGWLHAFSVLSNLPRATQSEIEQAVMHAKGVRFRGSSFDQNSCVLALLDPEAEDVAKDWSNFVRRSPLNAVLIGMSSTTLNLLAARSSGESEIWKSPAWSTALEHAIPRRKRPTSGNTGQRLQPKRRRRNKRR